MAFWQSASETRCQDLSVGMGDAIRATERRERWKSYGTDIKSPPRARVTWMLRRNDGP